MTVCSDLSTRDSNLPIDRGEVKDSILFYLEGVDDEQLPPERLDQIIEICISRFTDNQTFTCDVIYCALLESLKYLIRKGWVEEGGDSVGNLKRIREKEGSVEEEVEYQSPSSSIVDNGWEKLYNYFLENPSDICDCLKPIYNSTFGLINVGGTQQDKYQEIENGHNNRSMWDKNPLGVKFSARRELRRRKTMTRSKYWR